MTILRSNEQRCLFQVRCDHAQQVKLVIERRPGMSEIHRLHNAGGGIWQTTLDLPPGEYRYCYHAFNGRTLTYITPPDAPLDGLKAVLRIAPQIPAKQPISPHRGATLNRAGMNGASADAMPFRNTLPVHE